MVTLKREDTKEYLIAEAPVKVTYRIPDAAEAEAILDAANLGKDAEKDTQVFKKFVKEIVSSEIEGWDKGVKPEDIVSTPGTFGLVHLVAIDLVNAMRGNAQRKN